MKLHILQIKIFFSYVWKLEKTEYITNVLKKVPNSSKKFQIVLKISK